MALWEDFPTELPVRKLSLLLDVWRGNPVDPRDAALAALNVVGYAVGRGLISTAAVFGTAPETVIAPASPEVVENAFAVAMAQPMAAGPAAASGAAAAHGQPVTPTATMVAFDDTKKIPWQTILSVAIPILRKLILGF